MRPHKLSPIKALQLRQDYRSGLTLTQCADRYQCSYSTARNVVYGASPLASSNPGDRPAKPRETPRNPLRPRGVKPKLTPGQAAQLVAERSKGTLRSLGLKYGIDPITVWRYCKRAQARGIPQE